MDASEKYLRREEKMNVEEEIWKIRKDLKNTEKFELKRPGCRRALNIVLYVFILLLTFLGALLTYLIYIRDGSDAFRCDSSLFPNMF